MADYLPPDILNQFLKNAEAVSKGESSSSLNKDKADDKKITDSNIGYQLLSKSGWIEGSGLGATGSGIIQPLSATGSSNSNKVGGTIGTSSSSSSSSSCSSSNILNRPSVEGSGIGIHATHEVQANDNEFDQYRKRMMLAYRFRPNPLNNPRRDYY
jgi:splicing factor 4